MADRFAELSSELAEWWRAQAVFFVATGLDVDVCRAVAAAIFGDANKVKYVTLEPTQRFDAVKEGKVDILIGTHRLVSKDVQFPSLGLLVIDEEQKFGVKVKERLKQMRAEVDVLTLTATPIPRTLHMSLLGIRDISSLTTPPRDRVPIETRVGRFVTQHIMPCGVSSKELADQSGIYQRHIAGHHQPGAMRTMHMC